MFPKPANGSHSVRGNILIAQMLLLAHARTPDAVNERLFDAGHEGPKDIFPEGLGCVGSPLRAHCRAKRGRGAEHEPLGLHSVMYVRWQRALMSVQQRALRPPKATSGGCAVACCVSMHRLNLRPRL